MSRFNKLTRYLERAFGITATNYQEMYDQQEGHCGICGSHQSYLNKRLSVDHCHDTNAIRGLLCGECNLGLGMFRDSRVNLRAAIEYLTNPPAKELCLEIGQWSNIYRENNEPLPYIERLEAKRERERSLAMVSEEVA